MQRPLLVLGTGLLCAAPAAAQGGGRLSPASLDVDTCGCPTVFGAPTCEKRTSWTLDKTTSTGDLTDPQGAPFDFTVKVTEGPTTKNLSGSGTITLTNSGEQTTFLSSIAVMLEDLHTGPGKGDAPGPSGKNWDLLATAVENEAAACGSTANTCYGALSADAGSSLVLFDPDTNDVIALSSQLPIPPTADNDGDGLRDEDPALPSDPSLITGGCAVIDNDGDGQYDEDPIAGIDNDGDGLVDEDPIAGIDNDGDGAVDEDPVDGIDNDGDGLVDEDSADDDGDGLVDEDDADDDGDGLVDEDDPDDDGDGQVDEDGACEDAVVINFTYDFDVTGLGTEGPGDGIVPSDDDLRIDLVATFQALGKRGGTCTVDLNCDGNSDEYARSIQQRLRFDPVPCDPTCDAVSLVDNGAVSSDPSCVSVDSTTTLNETINATEVPGTMTVRQVTGTVSCIPQAGCDPLTNLEATLPSGTVQMVVSHPGNGFGGSSYFDTTVSGGGSFDGVYDAWCVDTDNTISPGSVYNAEFVSSYSAQAAALVENPGNLDLVNWIINQGFPGQTSPGCGGTYTYGDVQRAIWQLIEDSNSTAGVGPYSPCRQAEIVALAQANGDGFQPDCNESVAVIMNPVGNDQSGSGAGFQVTIFQITLIDVPGVCDPCVCHATITNTATLTCEDASLITGSPASASFDVWCTADNGDIGVGDFCSQTQGGWGTSCNGNNPGCLRDQYFAQVFPSGLVVGDPDGPDADGSHAILLTSAAAVEGYLPAGGTPSALTADQTDPAVTSSGVFGGQLVAATLNVAFDAAGLGACTLTGTCSFPNPPGTLGTLKFKQGCVATPLVGLTVNQVLALANTAISGGGTPAGVTVSDISDALAKVNQEFVDCQTVAGCLEF